jgi:hypothetical protein
MRQVTGISTAASQFRTDLVAGLPRILEHGCVDGLLLRHQRLTGMYVGRAQSFWSLR